MKYDCYFFLFLFQIDSPVRDSISCLMVLKPGIKVSEIKDKIIFLIDGIYPRRRCRGFGRSRPPVNYRTSYRKNQRNGKEREL